MYRYSTGGSSTPTSTAGRRSARAVRGSAKRRRSNGSTKRGRGGGGGSLKRKFEHAAECPAKKWVKVYRAPASNVSFKVAVWVPYADLTEEERLDYDDVSREREAAFSVQKLLPHEEEQAHSQGKNTNEAIYDTMDPVLKDGGMLENFLDEDKHISMLFGGDENSTHFIDVSNDEVKPSAKRPRIESGQTTT